MDADPPKIADEPSRWRFQFSLKMLFLLTALAAVLLSWWRVKRDTKQMELDAAVSGYAQADRDGSWDVHMRVPNGLRVLGRQVIADWIAAQGAHRVGGIWILRTYDERQSYREPVELAGGAWDYLVSLRLSRLSVCALDDRSVPQLTRLSSLEFLEIIFSTLTPDGEAQLRKALPQCKIELHDHGVAPRY